MFQKSANSFKGNGTVIQNRTLLCMWFPLKEYAILLRIRGTNHGVFPS